MLEDVYSDIFEKVDFTAMDKFEALIGKTISRAIIKSEDNPNVVSVSFKCAELFQGITQFANSKGKDQTLILGTETILKVTDALQFELDESEAFILYHIRNLGKFRKREAELLAELKNLWKQFPQFALEDREYSRALKSLMRDKFIQYRKGNIHLNPSFIIRYRI